MSANAAPSHAEIADGPAGGRAVWLSASDGVRIRVGLWAEGAPNGTVVLLPGRTEYVEKYGRSAADLAARGYATLAVDWRGQGLADRLQDDRMSGHVDDFDAYQRDLDAVFAFARATGLPEPYYMIAHSMGGCIGLRSLLRGILIAAWMRPLAVALSTASKYFAFDHRYAPGTGPRTYVLEAPFAGNTLTSDAEMWGYMRDQARAHPELTLGGPSLGWLKAALHECHALAQMPAPALPALVALGTQERIVDTGPIHARMALWPAGKLMARAAHRTRFFDSACTLFGVHR